DRRAARAPEDRRPRLCRPGARHLLGQARVRVAEPGRGRARRAGAVSLVRREPARPDQPDPRRPCTRRPPRPRLRAPGSGGRAREGRAAPPARPLVRGVGGGADGGLDPGRADRGGHAAADRPEHVHSGLISKRLRVSEPTAARPGPGLLPETLLRTLDVNLARRVEGLLAGDYRSQLIGRGTELAQLRPYDPEVDDVRHIDWKATARTGIPHVRVH